MTVAELMERLSRMDPNAPVGILLDWRMAIELERMKAAETIVSINRIEAVDPDTGFGYQIAFGGPQ